MHCLTELFCFCVECTGGISGDGHVLGRYLNYLVKVSPWAVMGDNG